ncbi:MAG: hypothetical protein KAS87_02535 [Candidatus Omnitrophica bacterium]|nr:hypothetical protein [Candidatus Omnitrophota bacterium]
MTVYEEIKQGLQDIIAPELRSIQTEIKRLDDKMDSGFARLDEKIDTGLARLDGKIDSGFARLDEKIDTGLARLDGKIDSGFARLDGKIDSVHNELGFVRNELLSKIENLDDKLEIAMQIRERLASVEAKMGALVH